MANSAAGRFGVTGLGGLLVAGAAEGSDYFTLAFFPNQLDPSAIAQFPGHASQAFVADYNADGIDDFRGGNSELGFYVSAPSP